MIDMDYRFDRGTYFLTIERHDGSEQELEYASYRAAAAAMEACKRWRTARKVTLVEIDDIAGARAGQVCATWEATD